MNDIIESVKTAPRRSYYTYKLWRMYRNHGYKVAPWHFMD